MDVLFLGIIIFLFFLAVFDLWVGVSNDAVNFLTSAVGSKAASFGRVIVVAAIGVFIGAAMSNGMMDIARHGIFNPTNLSFYDVIAIFMAAMVTDIIILDIFNSLGMPTSTTVSLVFELLGASFVVALFKTSAPESTLQMGDLLNTEKALSVIIGIFLSVAIAFVFGTVVQFLSRLIFTFEYKSRLKWKVGLFGGVACTAIVYFMLLKGIKDLTIMTPDLKVWVDNNTAFILIVSLVIFTLLMQILHWCKVNVFKVVVLLGTFSLAMAFAGNDLVNFIGVPLTAFASYQDYTTVGGGGNPHDFMMLSLLGSARTPLYFLIGAGMIMVLSLATSKKARQVTQTTVGLSSKTQGEEMFGSSRLGRSLVRATLNIYSWVSDHTPVSIRHWVNQRMDNSVTQEEDGAAFDLVRGALNLMLASVLIAVGTSLKLPLSTTFVTFMVAMGTSLADRAWGRESAVFRITGVISVIGGWFITAGVAFIGAGLVVCLMHMGGVFVMLAGGVIAIVLLIRNNIRFQNKGKDAPSETLFQTILTTKPAEVWPLLKIYINEKQKMFLNFVAECFSDITEGFINEKRKLLSRSEKALITEKDVLKGQRRKLTLCMRRVTPEIAMEKRTWFHLSNNMAMSMTYNLRRVNEACKEHVDNNFRPLPEEFHETFKSLCERIKAVLRDSESAIDDNNPEVIDELRRRCNEIKDELSYRVRDIYELLQKGDTDNMAVTYVYLNLLQESQEFVTALRKMLRASGKLNLAPSIYRSFSHNNIDQVYSNNLD